MSRRCFFLSLYLHCFQQLFCQCHWARKLLLLFFSITIQMGVGHTMLPCLEQIKLNHGVSIDFDEMRLVDVSYILVGKSQVFFMIILNCFVNFHEKPNVGIGINCKSTFLFWIFGKNRGKWKPRSNTIAQMRHTVFSLCFAFGRNFLMRRILILMYDNYGFVCFRWRFSLEDIEKWWFLERFKIRFNEQRFLFDVSLVENIHLQI